MSFDEEMKGEEFKTIAFYWLMNEQHNISLSAD